MKWYDMIQSWDFIHYSQACYS